MASVKSEIFNVQVTGSLNAKLQVKDWEDLQHQIENHSEWGDEFVRHTRGDFHLYDSREVDKGAVSGNPIEQKTLLRNADEYLTEQRIWVAGGRLTKPPPPVMVRVLHREDKSTQADASYVPKTHTRVITSLNAGIGPVTRFEELIENSIEATWQEKEPTIEVEFDDRRDKITVNDNGHGMTQEQLTKYAEIGLDRGAERVKNEEREEVCVSARVAAVTSKHSCHPKRT